MSLRTRRIGVVAGFAIIILSVLGFNLLKNLKSPPPRKPANQSITVVDTFHVKKGTISSRLPVQGELVAFDKIDLFAEVSGTLLETSRPFKVGSYFPKGSILVKIDETEARLSLLSQKSNLLNSITQMMPDLKIDYPESYRHWQQYLEDFDLEKPIPDLPEPADKQEKFFVASRNIYAQFYSIKSAEERLEKYVLSAPFSGVITASSIHPGTLIRAGQKIGELMRAGNYELEVTVPLSELAYVKPGFPVHLYSEDVKGNWTGRVKRVSNQVDPGTQTVRIFIGVQGADLREGMYLNGDIKGARIDGAVRLPKNVLVDQNKVYVYEDSTIHLRDVELIKLTTEEAVVRGLADGEAIISEIVPGLNDGARVNIREQNSPSPDSSATDPKASLSNIH